MESKKIEKSEVRTDLKKLNQFMKDLSESCKDYCVKIGIFGNKSERSKGQMTNPELAAIHEFGRVDGSIPKRSFLRMPLELKQENIIKQVQSSDNMKNLSFGKPVPVLVDLGHACEAIIQMAFDTRGFGTWAPNRISTIDMKTSRMSVKQRKKAGGAGTYSNSPLIDTGQLRRSVTSKVERNAGEGS